MPYKLRLDGFSEYFVKELKNDPELVDELVQKYTGKMKNLPCEVRLLGMFG